MRGTLHFVAPEDARWMLKLLTPRVITWMGRMYKQVGLDEAIFAQSEKVVINTLQGGKLLERKKMYRVLDAAGISTANQRGMHIIVYLAQKGIICFGPRQGKQHTLALLDEWIPPARELEREAALARLARRYFTSHGPATVQDFMWWTGLVAADARTALDLVQSELVSEEMNGRTYWLSPSTPTTTVTQSTAFLLPILDEYTVAYKDRTAVHPLGNSPETEYGIGANIVINGKLVGTWKRTIQKDSVLIEPIPFAPLSAAEQQAFVEAAHEYGRFIGLNVTFP
jgi:hypothetical protein